jgi:hypothetical protein
MRAQVLNPGCTPVSNEPRRTVTDPSSTPSATPGYLRTAHAVGELLQTHPSLAELHRWGIRVGVTGDAGTIRAEGVAIGKPNWPVFESRITAERWWQPEDAAHFQRIATRLAADLRMKWDRWQRGID